MAIDGSEMPGWVEPWDDIARSRWPDLLIGNGVSRRITERFGYDSLRSVAATISDPRLTPIAISVFDRMGLADFERVLGQLDRAALIADAVGYDRRPIDGVYENIRDSLIGAIAYVHPRYAEGGRDRLRRGSEFFSSFSRIFTTNYDLLLYWSVMANPDAFVDFFWSSDFNFAFDVTNVTVYGQRTMLHYLHGALMLYENEDGHVAKLVNDDLEPVLLDTIIERVRRREYPVFVSEGDHHAKLVAINEHTYLDFCLRRLAGSNLPLVVAGQGLGESDRHIVNALASSRRTNFAIGLWPRSAASLDRDRANIREALERSHPDGSSRILRFYDARTLNPWRGIARNS